MALRNRFHEIMFGLTMLIILLSHGFANAQSLSHPHIWVSYEDRQEILFNIENYNWAQSLFNQLKDRNEPKANFHATDQSACLSQITTIPGDRTTHREYLNLAAESAIMFYLTDEEKYAQMAGDILHHYVKMVSIQDPLTIDFFDVSRNDNHHIMMREDFPRIGIIYDFIQPFLIKDSTTVYDLELMEHVPFAFDKAQQSFKVMAEAVLKQGGINSNHPVLELTGGLYPTLCLEDDVIRQSYYDRFWNGDTKQNGITWMLDNFTKEEGMWPESVGYARGTHNIIIKIMNVIDRYDPERKIVQNNLKILDGIFIIENFKYPNDKIMAYGDLSRNDSDNAFIYRNVLAISHRLGLKGYFEKSASTLKAIYKSQGGYDPVIETQRLEWQNPLQLLWGVNIADTISANNPLYTSATARYAGVVMQRNYVQGNNRKYGLMYYTGGGTYVHAHATGLDMELYGAGYVIGPDYGSDTYGADIHETYAVSHAAHNTIIVNGTTHRAPKDGSTWKNIVDPIELVAYEPKRYEDPIAKYFCFATQYLNDKINKCDQQRTTSIVRTSPVSGYYVDVFRSKSRLENNFHDYIFHGLGDYMSLISRGEKVSLASTPNRYQNDIGDVRKQPGWRWFSNTKTSKPTSLPVKARFDLNIMKRYLHVNIPAGTEKEYSSATAPATKDVSYGYNKKDTRVLLMRKYGEAWNQPFVAVYEPSDNTEGTVQTVESIERDGQLVGLIVESLMNGNKITDFIITLEDEGRIELPEYLISFKGRFGIVRKETETNETDKVTLYIGSGDSLSYADVEIQTVNDKKGVQTFTGIAKHNTEKKLGLYTKTDGAGEIIKTPELNRYKAGAKVALTAHPANGYKFEGWSGDITGTAMTDTIIMSSHNSISAGFIPKPNFNLTLNAENGVISTEFELNEYPEGTCIELTAIPDEDYLFDSWTGDLTSTENPVMLCFDSDKDITANFIPKTFVIETKKNVLIFPNPSNGYFNITFPGKNHYSVLNMIGKTLLAGNAAGSFHLDLSAHGRGVYFLNMENSSISFSHKLMVK